jgi:hypothetical protein
MLSYQLQIIRLLFIFRGKSDMWPLVDEVVDVEGLSVFGDIYPSDSASQVAPALIMTSQRPVQTALIPTMPSDVGMIQNPSSSPPIQAEDSTLGLLGEASQEEIKAATTSIMNYGYDLNKVCAPKPPIPPPPPKVPKNKGLRFLKSLTVPKVSPTPDPRNEYSAGALCAAARRCNLLAVRLIVQKGVDVNCTQDNKSAMLQAIESTCSDSETTKMLETLVQLGANVSLRVEVPGYWNGAYDKFAYSPPSNLCAAVQAGKVDAVKFLLDQGVNIDEVGKEYHRDGSGSSALGTAARQLDEVLVELLLSRGASVNVGPPFYALPRFSSKRDFYIMTPLEECLRNKGDDSVTEKLLVAAGGIVNELRR